MGTGTPPPRLRIPLVSSQGETPWTTTSVSRPPASPTHGWMKRWSDDAAANLPTRNQRVSGANSPNGRNAVLHVDSSTCAAVIFWFLIRKNQTFFRNPISPQVYSRKFPNKRTAAEPKGSAFPRRASAAEPASAVVARAAPMHSGCGSGNTRNPLQAPG